MIDLIIHAGTKLALEQWLDARGLGTSFQDVDPGSPTFGQWFYTHEVGQWHWWNHPSGVVAKSVDNTDPLNPIVTNFSGFYGRLSLETIPEALQTWVETSTAVSVLDGVSGVGGAGITIVDPEQLREVITAGNAPLWDGLLGVGNQWSDPRLWAFQNVMIGDRRDFDGVTFESLIDFNVWSPTQYPAGWLEIGPAEPEPPAIPAWTEGTVYTVGDLVTYQGVTYRCIQNHTAFVGAGWNPPAVPSLWTVA